MATLPYTIALLHKSWVSRARRSKVPRISVNSRRWVSRCGAMSGCAAAAFRRITARRCMKVREVKAFMRRPENGGAKSEIWLLRANGDEILRGTASVGPDFPHSALDERLRALAPLADPVILADVKVGMRSPRTPVRGPAVGLFADQEIRLLDGPVLVSEPYDVEREVVALSGSRRTESVWVRSTLFAPTPRYAEEHAALYGQA